MTDAVLSDVAYAIVTSGTYMYVAGRDDTPDWRIEKRLLSSGALCTAANCGTEFGTAGVVTGAAASDLAYAIVIDGTYMYVAGDNLPLDWRIERRRLTDGSLE